MVAVIESGTDERFTPFTPLPEHGELPYLDDIAHESGIVHVMPDDEEPPEALDFKPTGDALSPEDAAELAWYLKGPRFSDADTESGFGAQLERAEALGFGPIPCRRCGGKWKSKHRKDGVEVEADWKDGRGWEPNPRFFPGKTTYAEALAILRRRVIKEQGLVVVERPTPELYADAVAQALAKEGKREITRIAFNELTNEVPIELCVPCEKCKGIGVVPRRSHTKHEVEAYPTGSSKPLGVHEMAVTISFASVVRYGRVERRLFNVANSSPFARMVLCRWHAPVIPNGIDAVVEETAAYHAAMAPGVPKGERGLLLARARIEAGKAYEVAARLWNGATS